MAEEQPNSLRLKAGPYLGEISALSFLPLPPRLRRSSSFPLLLAGTGSQLLAYDLATGELLTSCHAFGGVRVHGISLCSSDVQEGSNVDPDAAFETKIAVFGEKRAKLFDVRVGSGEMEGGSIDGQLVVRMELHRRLPRFNHWVLDALFLKEDRSLAVGLSDNSVAVWDVARSSLVLRVQSPDKCLLYSMRLWGDNIDTLLMASGTIYNEIIIWKLIAEDVPVVKDNCTSDAALINSIQHFSRTYLASHLCRLSGHEGSIFRIIWSSDGSKLMSASDDRSARVWMISGQQWDQSNESKAFGVSTHCLTLYGHDARIWDCCIFDSMYITVGEDCTCRIWSMNGSQLALIKEHIGRGIWRCLYDPEAGLLITAGFDSAIKVRQLHASSLRDSAIQNGVLDDFKDKVTTFSICTPNASEQLGFIDSKSEYVRCLHFARQDVLYVATNNGFVHCVKFWPQGDAVWTQLVRVSEEAPIICLDLISLNSSIDSTDVADIVAVGDGKGNATVIRVINHASKPEVVLSITWLAEAERQLLGIYWCKSLGYCHVFTTNPRGALKLWRIADTLQAGRNDSMMKSKTSLVAVFSTSFGTRITCLDASFKEEVLVCGDQRGGVTALPFPNSLLGSDAVVTEQKVNPLTHFKGAHGISTVSSALIGTLNSAEAEIRTTGGDGCLCYFKLNRTSKILEFIGMKLVKELSLIKSVVDNSNNDLDFVQGQFAVGFTSADFIIWNLMDELKIAQVTCGGWRRPYSYYFGDYPETQHCFAFLKEHMIHVHRLWVSRSERQLLSKVIRMQFHGREIHTSCFISSALQADHLVDNDLWIATGCEDGTVRLARYASNMDGWSCSQLLGEHVGGSAVRSLCFTPKIHTVWTNQTCKSDGSTCCASHNTTNNLFLLISVGAKQVLTAWILQDRPFTEKDALVETMHSEKKSHLRNEASLSFQWLSTHVPSKHSSTLKKFGSLKMTSEVADVSSEKSSPAILLCCDGNRRVDSKQLVMHNDENDWRYMAVTAFVVKASDCRFTMCFIVVAGSDATLAVRALLLPHRLWFDVALLVPQTSPVLSLQHVVFPLNDNFKHCQISDAYIVISGSTCGAITVWDLTGIVQQFMQYISNFHPENLIDSQRRPRTGRGSQGGRWWKSSPNPSLRKDNGYVLNGVIADKRHDNRKTNESTEIFETENGQSVSVNLNSGSCQTNGMKSKLMPTGISEVQPMLVLESVHQSGVNCLHVSETKSSSLSTSGLSFCVLSGGDDESLHSLVFDLERQKTYTDCTENLHDTDVIPHEQLETNNQSLDYDLTGKCSICTDYKIRLLSTDRVASAHSSAVKGVWTDGSWVFSTGLDQRVRCWFIDDCSQLVEYGHVIISVPEPETLDAVLCERNQYKIAVAGRGMQMVEFVVPCDGNE